MLCSTINTAALLRDADSMSLNALFDHSLLSFILFFHIGDSNTHTTHTPMSLTSRAIAGEHTLHGYSAQDQPLKHKASNLKMSGLHVNVLQETE